MKKKKREPQSQIRQYVLTGAGLGLYFGWFFRPVREPSIWTIIGLSVVITLVMLGLRWRRGERDGIPKFAAGVFVRYALGIAILEARHFAFDFGGRVAVTIMTIICAALFGYWLAQKESQS